MDRWPQHWRPLDHDPATLIRCRRLRGWTQRKLATEARISAGFLSELEAGHRNANEAMLRRLAKPLKVSWRTLQRRERRYTSQ